MDSLTLNFKQRFIQEVFLVLIFLNKIILGQFFWRHWHPAYLAKLNNWFSIVLFHPRYKIQAQQKILQCSLLKCWKNGESFGLFLIVDNFKTTARIYTDCIHISKINKQPKPRHHFYILKFILKYQSVNQKCHV